MYKRQIVGSNLIDMLLYARLAKNYGDSDVRIISVIDQDSLTYINKKEFEKTCLLYTSATDMWNGIKEKKNEAADAAEEAFDAAEEKIEEIFEEEKKEEKEE